jgi:hypothetical protein
LSSDRRKQEVETNDIDLRIMNFKNKPGIPRKIKDV